MGVSTGEQGEWEELQSITSKLFWWRGTAGITLEQDCQHRGLSAIMGNYTSVFVRAKYKVAQKMFITVQSKRKKTKKTNKKSRANEKQTRNGERANKL